MYETEGARTGAIAVIPAKDEAANERRGPWSDVAGLSPCAAMVENGASADADKERLVVSGIGDGSAYRLRSDPSDGALTNVNRENSPAPCV